MYNRKFEVIEEQTAAFLENAVNRVKSDSDIESLAELTKLFKKNVPLSLRKYVAAYLLREALKHDHSFRRGRFEHSHRESFRNEKNSERQRYEEKNENSSTEETRSFHTRVEIPEDQSTTIFISVGRNRKVFPRDLVSLLINVGGVERERIGSIKVLANYSFVELYKDDTDKAIQSLNDYEYRGKKLSVNLSRQKGEEETSDVVASQNEDEVMSAEDAAAYAAAEKAAGNEGFGS